LHRPPAAAVLVAFALRPRQVPERLRSPLERAHRAGLLTRLELNALTRAEAHELLRPTEDAWLTDLYEESGGNPFYLQQLARGGQPSARTKGLELTLDGVDVPPAVAAALGEELALLSDDARQGLDGAAVAGDPFEPELAAAAADISDPVLLTTLDELLALDLIRPTDVPRRFRFRHPLVRRVVY
jgi:predicted ATPase